MKLKPVRGLAFVAVTAAFLLLLPLALGAQAKTGVATAGTGLASGGLPASFPSPVSGDYVVYRDYSWEKPTWIGFLYYDDSTYGAVAVTPSSGANVSVLFRVETVDGKLVLIGQNIVSKITQSDVVTVNYLMSLLPDLYAWQQGSGVQRRATAGTATVPAVALRSLLLPAAIVHSLNKVEFGGDVSLRFVPEVPVFNLQGMTGIGGKPILELARVGRIRSGEDSSFFGFTPVPVQVALKEGTPLVLSPSRKGDSKTVDGITLKLDGQWTMVADNTFFLGDTAVLIVDTVDLAALGLPTEKLKPANLPLALVTLFSLSSSTSWAIPAELMVSGTEKRFRIENLFYDSETGHANRDIKICIPLADHTCTVISLSVSDTAYQANKAYFESLF